jgi:hypothetical protein
MIGANIPTPPAAGIGGSTGSTDNAILRADGTGGSTSQSSAIVIDDATTSTQANVAIVNAHSETNSSLVLSPKGTGALLAQKPNGAASGGNARGNYAVDLQLQRGSAAQVASGANSFTAGYGNTASNGGTIALGWGNTASGEYSFAGGVGSFATQTAAIAFGNAVFAQAGESMVAGGVSNQTTGSNSGILGGQQAVADRRGMHAHASGRFASNGDAQRARFVLRNKTTTNSAVELFLDGSATRLTIPSGKYLTGTINIAGIKSDGSAAASYIRQFSIKNVAGTTSLVGTVNTIGTDEAASTSISITANDTNDALKVEVTGIASETWRWVAAVDVVEVAYGA